jgi:hypothetical protein
MGAGSLPRVCIDANRVLKSATFYISDCFIHALREAVGAGVEEGGRFGITLGDGLCCPGVRDVRTQRVFFGPVGRGWLVLYVIVGRQPIGVVLSDSIRT